MSRPTPEAYYKAQLDKAMRNDDTKKISSLMRKLQSLNARKATKVKDAPVPKRRRRPTADPRPTASPMPRRRRRPTADPRPTLVDRPQRRRPTADPRPTSTLPRRRRRPTSEAQRQRQAILRRRALARARQRAALRGLPKGSNPRTRGQMSAAMKRVMEKQREAAQKRARQQRAKRDQRSARGAKLAEESRKKLMKLTGGRSLNQMVGKITGKLTKPVAKSLKKKPTQPRELDYGKSRPGRNTRAPIRRS
tara:strand:- start:10 stop:759 length:750 start_codon:yes stop_codon:yes gene_type:complete